jgi:hypothetical protein
MASELELSVEQVRRTSKAVRRRSMTSELGKKEAKESAIVRVGRGANQFEKCGRVRQCRLLRCTHTHISTSRDESGREREWKRSRGRANKRGRRRRAETQTEPEANGSRILRPEVNGSSERRVRWRRNGYGTHRRRTEARRND